MDVLHRLADLRRPGETVLWHTRPRAVRVHLRHLVLAAEVAVPLVLSAAVVLLVAALETPSGYVPPLVALERGIGVLVLLALLPLGAAPITAHVRLRRSVYAVTDKRVLALDGLLGYRLEEASWDEVTGVDTARGLADLLTGTGTLRFLTPGRDDGGWTYETTLTIGFISVGGKDRDPAVEWPDVEDVDGTLDRVRVDTAVVDEADLSR